MLNTLRKQAKGWIAQLFIALLVLSFAVWGVSDIFRGFGGDTVAAVGGTEVTVQEFARQYDFTRRQLEAQMRRPVSPEEARLNGLPGRVLGGLISDATLSDQARSLRLGISGDSLAAEIADDPSFRGTGGTFDRNQFTQLLRSAGYSEDEYVEWLRERYIRNQVTDALVGGIESPQAYLRALHNYATEQRDISYLILSPEAIPDVGTPSESDLEAYFEENKADWRAPELRAVRIMALTPADLADSGEISDEAAREVYDSQAETRFTTPERRRVSQILFETPAEAEAAAAALADGKGFEEMVAEQELDPEDVDLGLVTHDAILDPAVADAAFGLDAGAVSEVVDGRFGPVLVRVTEVVPETVEPFDAVKEEIKLELAERRAAAEIGDLLNVIEDARAGGQTLDEVAANYDLDIREIPAIDSSGMDAAGDAVTDLPGGREMVTAIFETDVGIENNPIPLDEGYAWYELTKVDPARDRELSEVREKVDEAWRTDKLDEALTAKAEEYAVRLAGGADITELSTEPGVSAGTAEG